MADRTADGDRVLLGLRQGTGYADGRRVLPSGKLEAGEGVVTAVVRETSEEIGAWLDRGMVRLAAMDHHRGWAGQGRVGLVFAAVYEPARYGQPVNAEPHKCAEIECYRPPACQRIRTHHRSCRRGVVRWGCSSVAGCSGDARARRGRRRG
ncbi:NUDIX domain-containing protein [Micromonospora foliorum]|uniref:NUDIX domain-containing protein n=1 Tax=Micromonospora foliorum TaxID=2911210 RepID=UPI00355791F6